MHHVTNAEPELCVERVYCLTFFSSVAVNMANSEFRNKLTVLLEDLIKTAMVDICTLADVCTTNLHMELNASRSQNKELKRKLHIMQQSLYNTTLLQSQDDQNKPTPATDAGCKHGFRHSSCFVCVTVNIVSLNSAQFAILINPHESN